MTQKKEEQDIKNQMVAKTASYALNARGIRCWQVIPEVFHYQIEKDNVPSLNFKV